MEKAAGDFKKSLLLSLFVWRNLASHAASLCCNMQKSRILTGVSLDSKANRDNCKVYNPDHV